jgi:hypothetical protein
MKDIYFFRFTLKVGLSLLLSFLICCSAKTTYAQLMTDTTSAKVRIVSGTGTLSSTTFNYVHNPAAFGIDSVYANGTFAKTILLNWPTNIDNANVLVKFDHMTSLNGGTTWGAKITGVGGDPELSSIIKLKSGKIVSINFKPLYIDAPTYPARDKQHYPFDYNTSTNNGASWTLHAYNRTTPLDTTVGGMVDFTPFSVDGIRFHRGIIEDNGVLYANAYITYVGSTTHSQILKSVNDGKTWTPMLDGSGNPIFIGQGHTNSNLATDESTLERCANGDWLVVMRQGIAASPLLISRSSDKGQTWTQFNYITGLPSYPKAVNPQLMLMPNGVMVLTYGKPDQHLVFSLDGNGTTWSNVETTYIDANEQRATSANSAIVSIGSNKLLQFGDYYSETSNPNTQGIWQKEIELVRPEQDRIDLKTKQSLGLVTIMSPQTTLTYTNASHPETRLIGPFDGSTRYWSGAFAAVGATSGVYQLDLQKTYNIKTIGVALAYGKTEDATVELSPDGTTWTNVKTYTNATHYCVNYTNITPMLARYVKITLNGSSQVGLGELELYEASSTFEGNATTPTATVHGIIPPGYASYGTSSTLHGMSVRENVGYQSNNGLVLYDGSGGWISGIKKIVSASNRKTLEFRCRAAAVPTGGSFSMRMMGTVSGAENVVFYLAVFPDGSIKANDHLGATGFDKLIAPAGTIPVGSSAAWKLIKIEANESADSAAVYVDGVYKATTTMFATPSTATNLTGFAFASNGTATLGEIVYFDDVNLYDPTIEGPSGITSASATTAILSSSLVPQKQTESNAFSIAVSPNPASEVVKIIVKGASAGVLNIQFTSLWGKKSKQLKYSLEDGSSELNVPIGGLSQGLYVLTATQNGHVSQTKLIVK